jgi:hypothetical protein
MAHFEWIQSSPTRAICWPMLTSFEQYGQREYFLARITRLALTARSQSPSSTAGLEFDLGVLLFDSALDLAPARYYLYRRYEDHHLEMEGQNL